MLISLSCKVCRFLRNLTQKKANVSELKDKEVTFFFEICNNLYNIYFVNNKVQNVNFHWILLDPIIDMLVFDIKVEKLV